MNMKNNRIVYRKDGEWVNKKTGSDRALSVHNKQSQAEKAAREMGKNTGGGALIFSGNPFLKHFLRFFFFYIIIRYGQ